MLRQQHNQRYSDIIKKTAQLSFVNASQTSRQLYLATPLLLSHAYSAMHVISAAAQTML